MKNLILQSRWLWSGNIGWSYLFLTPLLTLHYTLSPSVITRWIPLWIEGQVLFWLLKTSMINSKHGISLSFPLPLSVFQFFLVLSTLLFHPLSPNQSSVIRQLHKLYREVFAMCVCGVCVERSWMGLCMCTLVRVQSEFTSSWLNIFSLQTKINKWSFI